MLSQVLTVVLLLSAIARSTEGLTSAQIRKFKSKGVVESNTKKAGTVSVTAYDTYYLFVSNGIPDHTTGNYPNRDNPNDLKEVTLSIKIPKNPKKASKPACLPMGPIGMAINGVAIFNPYTLEKKDALVHEVMDSCGGHPAPKPEGQYHYHGIPTCLYKKSPNMLLGIAMDGYPIYGPLLANGSTVKSSDLDKCHGGTVDGDYRYFATDTWPYYLGCFTGTTINSGRRAPECYYSYNSSTTLRCGWSLTLMMTVFMFVIFRE